MKYKDIDIKIAKKICKQHGYKDKDGKPKFNCDKCPLRRSEIYKGVEIHKFCYFILMSIYDRTIEWCRKLQEEEIQHQDEYDKFIERFDTTD